jgi:hypothetical protein
MHLRNLVGNGVSHTHIYVRYMYVQIFFEEVQLYGRVWGRIIIKS